MGGALSTAGGLVFIGAGRDTKLRAFEIGKVLWEAELPASAQATPMSYRSTIWWPSRCREHAHGARCIVEPVSRRRHSHASCISLRFR
jgi:hypothetical protein